MNIISKIFFLGVSFMAESKQLFNQSFIVFDTKKQKRKKTRVRLSTPAQFILNSNKLKPINCNLIDLGTGGLTVQAPTALYTGDKLTVQFKLNNEMMNITGVVARGAGKDYVIRYEELPEKENGIIQDYIHKVFFKDKDSK